METYQRKVGVGIPFPLGTWSLRANQNGNAWKPKGMEHTAGGGQVEKGLLDRGRKEKAGLQWSGEKGQNIQKAK